MIIIAICVYDRYDNLKRWLHAWTQCENMNFAQLIIIHNDNGEAEKFKSLCDEHGVKYIHRENIGFDIGAFQDICRERLPGFPNNWDKLLWLADDTLPTAKDFISPYLAKIDLPKVGVVALEITKLKAPLHIRTTGFMIHKHVATKLKFPADPITTKEHCYEFEHRPTRYSKTFLYQIQAMGLRAAMLGPLETAPLWDSHRRAQLNRLHEYEDTFNPRVYNEKVVFISTIYESYPQIVSSLLMQTHKNWELILIHDGPNSNGLRSMIDDDPRIKLIETEKRLGNWGHFYRAWALEEMKAGRLSDAEYVVITNSDNYYVPAFTNSLLTGFRKNRAAIATYCENIVHSYIGWGVMPVKLVLGHIDCGGVMIKREAACEVGWTDVHTHSSDWTYFRGVIKRYGPASWIKIKGTLFVHN